jgi:hypothetical protein
VFVALCIVFCGQHALATEPVATVNVEFYHMYSYVDPLDSVVAGKYFCSYEKPRFVGRRRNDSQHN